MIDCIAMIDFDDTIVERTLCRTLCSSSCIKMFINTKNVHNTHIYILHAYTWGLIHRITGSVALAQPDDLRI